MKADFLDNLTERLGEPNELALQPRLASRFEEIASPGGSGLLDEASMEQADKPSEIEFARPVTSPPRAKKAAASDNSQRVIQPHPVGRDSVVPHVVAPPENAESTESDRSVPDDQLAVHLDAVSRELDRLAGHFEKMPTAPAVGIEDSKWQSLSDAEPVAAERTIINQTVVEHQHHYSRTAEKTVQVASPTSDRSPELPPTILIETADHVPESVQSEVGRSALTARDIEKNSSEHNVYDVPHVIVPPIRHPSDALQAAGHDQPVPEIVVEARAEKSASERTVNVTIGRIEVRAVQPKPVAAPAKPRSTSRSLMSLDDYLKRRAGGSR